MTAAQMLDVLSAAMRRADTRSPSRWPGWRRRTVILSLRSPEVLGRIGKPDGLDAQDMPVYGFTYRQCKAMYEEIVQAVRDDMGTMGVPG